MNIQETREKIKKLLDMSIVDNNKVDEAIEQYAKQEAKKEVLKWHKIIGDFLELINNQIENNEVFGDFSQFNPQQLKDK